jgi:hypothetical protein
LELFADAALTDMKLRFHDTSSSLATVLIVSLIFISIPGYICTYNLLPTRTVRCCLGHIGMMVGDRQWGRHFYWYYKYFPSEAGGRSRESRRGGYFPDEETLAAGTGPRSDGKEFGSYCPKREV